MKLRDRVAIVTGGSQGIGRAIALAFAGEGARLCLVSRSQDKYAYPLRTPYNASKWAVAGVTQTIAAEAGLHHIRCNCLSPGPVQGERFWNVIHAKADAMGKTFEEMKQWWEEQVPLRRFVTEEEVSRTALFLVSDDSAGITGQQICVSGGMEVM